MCGQIVSLISLEHVQIIPWSEKDSDGKDDILKVKVRDCSQGFQADKGSMWDYNFRNFKHWRVQSICMHGITMWYQFTLHAKEIHRHKQECFFWQYYSFSALSWFLNYLPTTFQLKQAAYSVSLTPDGACLVVTQTKGNNLAIVMTYHWCTFSSMEGIPLDLSPLMIKNGPVVTLLVNQVIVHVMGLDCEAHVLLLKSYKLVKKGMYALSGYLPNHFCSSFKWSWHGQNEVQGMSECLHNDLNKIQSP
ncbi:hypothetical protein HD554DRAFT_2040148 [Boletus coccyginus]|nr:hypothetical protein HD554DRAFT_2040148 [Boletus coccyginus]